MSNWPLSPHRRPSCAAVNWPPENTPRQSTWGQKYGHKMMSNLTRSYRRMARSFLLHDDNLERTSNGWGRRG
ncbi:hypothetical protein HT118_11175 [Escherichia coli]|nr:hypothetical protein [Escherichia coli]